MNLNDVVKDEKLRVKLRWLAKYFNAQKMFIVDNSTYEEYHRGNDEGWFMKKGERKWR